MSSRLNDLALTALAPIIWGSSYIVSTEFLPGWPPLVVGLLRALPAGLVLLAITRRLPSRDWLGRVALLGALNFTVFWGALFIAAYRLPGGVAATLGALQPLFVTVLASLLLGAPLRLAAVLAALAGAGGVGLLILGPGAALDPMGVVAALIGALSMATGMVLTLRWTPPVDRLTFVAWQLTAGGVLLIPVALIVGGDVPSVDLKAVAGLVWLGLIGGALTYVIFFRGMSILGAPVASGLGFLSPLSAVTLGWVILGQALNARQLIGAGVVLLSVWAVQKVNRRPAPKPQAEPQPQAVSSAAARSVRV